MIEISASHAEVPESFGQFLRREREVRDITLEEIASYTRIKLRALDAIERDDFASLPPLAFIRAFIRCYADYLGLNVADVMMRFDAFVQARYPELTGEVTLIQKQSRPKQKYVPLILGIVVVLMIAVGIWARGDGPKKDDNNGNGDLVAINNGDTERTGHSDPDTDIDPPPTEGGTVIDPATDRNHPDDPPPIDPPIDPPVDPPDTPDTPPENPDLTEVEPPPFNPAPWIGHSRDPLGPPRDVEDQPGADPATPDENPGASSQGPHRVELKLKANCFTSYVADDNPAKVVILEPGLWVFEAEHKLKISLSNPAGVESVTHNGQPVEFKPTCYPWWLYFPSSPNDNPCPHQR